MSTKIYFGLILALAILAAVSVFLPGFQDLAPTAELPASKPVLALANAGIMLIIYGGLGFLGLKLGPKIGFTDLWDPTVSNKQRFLIPALVGAGLGVFLIIADAVFSRFNTLGPLPHPPFPTSIVASLTAGIGEEVLFRLFFISLWVWVISRVILKGRWQNRIFWIITGLSALVFSLGHIPSAMIIFDLSSVSEIPPVILAEMLLLNGTVSVFAAYYFREFGFLAPVGIHFWTDVVWHVIWPLI